MDEMHCQTKLNLQLIFFVFRLPQNVFTLIKVVQIISIPFCHLQYFVL